MIIVIYYFFINSLTYSQNVTSDLFGSLNPNGLRDYCSTVVFISSIK